MEAKKRSSALGGKYKEAKEKFKRKPGVIPNVKGADDPDYQGMLVQATQNHVESFNAFLEDGLHQIAKQIPPIHIEPEEEKQSMTVSLTDLRIANPVTEGGRKIVPKECRLGHLTYGGALTGKLQFIVGGEPCTIEVGLGDIPIMVKSSKCNLTGLKPQEVVARGEDETEAGGYFLIHGLERCVRLLIVPKYNYPMAVVRSSYKSRGALYTKYAVIMRCMRPDSSSQTNSLHYTSDGGCYLRFSSSREEFLIPLMVVLHACMPTTDQQLGEMLAGPASKADKKGNAAMEGGHSDDMWTCVLLMIQQQQAKHPVSGVSDARRHLGRCFRVLIGSRLSRTATDEQVGEFLVKRWIMVHTEHPQQKLASLVIMFQKLMGLVTGAIREDSQDQMCNHSVLLPGSLFSSVLRENLERYMSMLKVALAKSLYASEDGVKKYTVENFKSNATLCQKYAKLAGGVGRAISTFVSTGNIASKDGLDLMQASGYSVVADKLNQARFSSHFGAVHRGQYFTQMKTTTVRKLLPETWGFLCPVHTPDGEPCGLLNHLAASCRAVTRFPEPNASASVVTTLVNLGLHVIEAQSKFCPVPIFDRSKHCWVLLDGVPLGFVESTRLQYIEGHLRECKVHMKSGVPAELEIVGISKKTSGGRLFPGLFLFLGPGRLVRPVSHISSEKVEWIGPLEQLFLNISVLPEERHKALALLSKDRKKEEKADDDELPEQLPIKFSHEELDPCRMLSLLACMTPFSNHNQSPRNMYQCQMLKQTMGTPYHNHVYRTDNKVFRVLFPQKPMVKTKMYDTANCDLHPTGTNAVVAVITYTGYDMEDAMLINKASYERGFKHGVVYKTKLLESASKSVPSEAAKRHKFSNIISGGPGRPVAKASDVLDDDGFPPIGTYLTNGDPMYCVVDAAGKAHVHTYHDDEPAYVEQVTLIDAERADAGATPCQRCNMKLRYVRNPVVGDKFASRHGQKGVMSLLWPQEDMPFTEGGVTPDILFNPHGFPSRMTIGMLIESVAGKAAASEGRSSANASTFRGYKGLYHEDDNNNEHDPFLQTETGPPTTGHTRVGGLGVADYFGDTLKKHGFKKLGTERMYSGIHGTEFETDIFVGVIYYQRLRHLVMDKAQARARGPNDRLTMQPVKGRKRGGGIRFGEMERDSLIAHGAAYLLHDRLFRCSDFDTAYVCPHCGSILTPQANAQTDKGVQRDDTAVQGDPWECPPCSKRAKQIVRCHPIPVPWVFRYLVCELAAMNVRVNLRVSERGRQTSLSCLNDE